MTSDTEGRVRVCSIPELQEKGHVVKAAGGRTVVVFHHEEQFFAVDNRCPHMGFPLSRGTVRDGILTCHWPWGCKNTSALISLI